MCLYVCACVQVMSADGTQEVGKITKQFSGLAKEFFTTADNFGIQCKTASDNECKCLINMQDTGFLCLIPSLPPKQANFMKR